MDREIVATVPNGFRLDTALGRTDDEYLKAFMRLQAETIVRLAASFRAAAGTTETSVEAARTVSPSTRVRLLVSALVDMVEPVGPSDLREVLGWDLYEVRRRMSDASRLGLVRHADNNGRTDSNRREMRYVVSTAGLVLVAQ